MAFRSIWFLLAFLASDATATADDRPPNFVVILCDNLGYGDVGCYGSKLHRTPNVDRLAAEGLKLTDFYVASGVCTPSRAALMTGCYPRRVDMHVSDIGHAVLQPVSPKGLHPDEVTIAEVLKTCGYATACIGKWHLGDQPPLLPTRQGFDLFYGVPYSDDMTPRPGKPWPDLPLMRGDTVVEAPADRDTLTKRYTEESVKFIAANKDRPFFLYLPHAMPGSTKHPFSSQAFRGQSKNGDYGDSVEEIDWSTGEIMAALKKHRVDENTLVVWTSDNGAPRRTPVQGTNAPLAGWGYSTAEGGMRVPCLVRWPGHIPAGRVSRELTTAMDMLPTFAHLAEAEMPADRVIDGKDITPILFGKPGAKSPHESFFYYQVEQLQAVRSGKWKLYLPLASKRGLGAGAAKPTAAQLFDVVADPGETRDLVAEHPKVVDRLAALAEAARADLGDGKQVGAGQRPAGRVTPATPRVLPVP